jgi:peptidyl-prolyl cis-trans isomerase A (cyclophilin A)
MKSKSCFPQKSRQLVGVSILTGAVALLLLSNPAQAVPLPIATFNTSLGSFEVELRPDVAPLTVQNFINYVDSGAYNNTMIHRSMPGFVIQGGGYSVNGAPFTAATPPAHIATNAPVQNEFHLSNVVGTIAMAKLGGDPNSATSEWFFNLADNSSNLDNQNGGFTVFGDVLGNGMDVINAIAAVPVYTTAQFWGSAFSNLPLVNLTPSNSIAAANFVVINSVTVTAPEPATCVLLLSGLVWAGIGARARYRRHHKKHPLQQQHVGVGPVCAARDRI